MEAPPPLRRVRRTLTAPLRSYLDSRFDRIEERLDRTQAAQPSTQEALLARVDLTEHNRGTPPPTFERVISQAVSASQFSESEFERLRQLVWPGTSVLPTGGAALHRKVWEFVYVLRAAEQHGLLDAHRRAVGFGVGREPVPAVLASFGVQTLATDLEASEAEKANWTTTGQHLSDLRALSYPEIVSDEDLERHVRLAYVDMNAIPNDLGSFDLAWSCCALEHLGSPQAGLSFVLRTLDLLRPGGVSVHTTELELTRRRETADYDHIVVYRTEDLDDLAADVRRRGFEIETNWYISMESPADRWIGVPPYDDQAHLKLVIGDSISTSVGILVRRPSEATDESNA